MTRLNFRIFIVYIIVLVLCHSSLNAQEQDTLSLSQNPVFTLEFSSPILTIEFSPDSTLFAISQDNGDTVSLWNIDTGEMLQTFSGETFHVSSLAWNPIGDTLAALGNRVVVWNINTNQNLHILDYPANEANGGSVDWSPDGEYLAFIRWNYDNENPFGSITQILNQDSGEIADIGRRLTTGLATAKWSPNGQIIAISDNDIISIWNVDSGELVMEFENVEDVNDIAWSPNSDMIVAGISNGVDVTRNDTDGYNYSRIIQIWDVISGDIILTMEGHIGSVSSVDWSPDGNFIASAGRDSTIRVWDARTGQIVFLNEDHENGVNSVVWSPDGNLLGSGGQDGNVFIWDVSELQQQED